MPVGHFSLSVYSNPATVYVKDVRRLYLSVVFSPQVAASIDKPRVCPCSGYHSSKACFVIGWMKVKSKLVGLLARANWASGWRRSRPGGMDSSFVTSQKRTLPPGRGSVLDVAGAVA